MVSVVTIHRKNIVETQKKTYLNYNLFGGRVAVLVPICISDFIYFNSDMFCLRSSF